MVPAAAARELAELFPLWLRVLKGHPGAGRTEAELAAEAAAKAEPSEAAGEPKVAAEGSSETASETVAGSDGGA